MRRLFGALAVTVSISVVAAEGALACGGLVAPNGSVNLLRTSTLAGYHNGVEHYITSFEFTGGGGKFGSIVPLPGIPKLVRRAGDWTLQRLQLEVAPVVLEDADARATFGTLSANAKVIYETRIDGLDITILEGGGYAVGRWAERNGFGLSPDAPEVLDFYAARSPIFMAARFDAAAAKRKGFSEGDGVPIHVSIPTDNPWVPLRILALGKEGSEIIEADVFLLTDIAPALLPNPRPAGSRRGMVIERSEPASDDLLRDLRSDKRMKWLPASDMWLTYLRIDKRAGNLTHDLAVDVSGENAPSPIAAGLVSPDKPAPDDSLTSDLWPWVAAGMAIGIVPLTGRVLKPKKK